MFIFALLMFFLSLIAAIYYDSWRITYRSRKEHDKWTETIGAVWGLEREKDEPIEIYRERLREHIDVPMRGGIVPHHLRAEWNRPAWVTKEEWYGAEEK